MAGVSEGNLWSGESRAGGLWSSMFLQTTTEANTEMGNFNWASEVAANSAGLENGNISNIASSSSDLTAALASLGPPDSENLLASVGGFNGHVVADLEAWNQTLLRSRGEESVQNMQTSLENLSEAFFSRQKEVVGIPSEWEMVNITSQDTNFCDMSKETGFRHLLHNTIPASNLDHGRLTLSNIPPVTSFTNPGLPLSLPQFEIARIKKECSLLHTANCPSTIDSDAYSTKQGFSDIIDNRSLLKAMAGQCYNNGSEFMQGEDQFNPNLWSSNSSSRFSTSPFSHISPPSSQPIHVLNTHRNSPLWDLIKPQHSQSSLQNFPQFLQEGKRQANSMTQHLKMSHVDEARDCNSNDVKKCSTDQSSTSETLFKRPRLDTTSSGMPTFKVRKEKLGDRITALQQLVSPFGKTDTASVLLEAIGYIKFLHEQVQVLSTPYMNNGAANSAQGDQTAWAGSSDSTDSDGPKQDLRSRGLCLVPVSSTLSVTNDNGADYWTPALGCNYR